MEARIHKRRICLGMYHKPGLISGNQMCVCVWKAKRQQQRVQKLCPNPQSVPQMRLKFASKQIIPIRVRHTACTHTCTHTSHQLMSSSSACSPSLPHFTVSWLRFLLSGCLSIINSSTLSLSVRPLRPLSLIYKCGALVFDNPIELSRLAQMRTSLSNKYMCLYVWH